MHALALIGMYSLLIVAGSLFGGWLPTRVRLTHVRMQIVLSLVGGLMLGVGLLHMLPHSYAELNSLDATLAWVLAGLLGMFFLIRTFHFHQHDPAANGGHDHGGHDHGSHDRGSHDHAPAAPHDPSDRHADPGRRGGSAHSWSWLGVACGLALHTLIDGVALGAAVVADSAHPAEGVAAGFGVFAAILTHKPLDALSITTLMRAGGWSVRAQQLVNAGFAVMCPLGAIAFFLGVQHFGEARHQAVGIALAISAGVFLCISLSDLLPEVQFHRHDRLKLSSALLLGVLCAYGIRYLEPPHTDHRHEAPSELVPEADR